MENTETTYRVLLVGGTTYDYAVKDEALRDAEAWATRYRCVAEVFVPGAGGAPAPMVAEFDGR